MKRVGYDADTQRHYFQDSNGAVWEGPEGVEFPDGSQLKQTSNVVGEPPSSEDEPDVPSFRRGDGYEPLAMAERQAGALPDRHASPYRMLMPFFLLVIVFILLVLRIVNYSTSPPPPCPPSTTSYYIASGDTCWDIAQASGISVDSLREQNPGINCDKLSVGKRLCLPKSRSQRRKSS